MSVFEYGYWGIRGLGAPGRMLLAYGGLQVKDHQLAVKEDAKGTLSMAAWFDEAKPPLQKEHPLINLPYVRFPCGKLVTQSTVVYRSIASKVGLAPKTPDEAELVDQVLAEVMDLRNNAIPVYYGAKQQPADEYLEGARKGSFAKLESWFALKGTPYAAGAEPRACDFFLFEMIDQHIKIFGVMPAVAKAQGLSSFKVGVLPKADAKPKLPECTKELFAAYDAAAETVFPMSRFPKLRAFHARFRAQPQLKGYFDSASYRMASNGPPAPYDGADTVRV